ncbi:hypothetical protein ACG9XR_15010 [Acinetobacter guillouiae]|uniref:Uncharacterized protein n=1 Tax=Acinetobacter guillouiae TaxID=106649 RepID=A0A8X8KHD5_ACIGI|nr:hypothetical protein [Acinetobacter guillouiae]MBP2546491.1 hypothetical protein [Acinetobacter guillouiae]MCF0266981.1 hypothetical protein [Acinetobacter guillouiae]
MLLYRVVSKHRQTRNVVLKAFDLLSLLHIQDQKKLVLDMCSTRNTVREIAM